MRENLHYLPDEAIRVDDCLIDIHPVALALVNRHRLAVAVNGGIAQLGNQHGVGHVQKRIHQHAQAAVLRLKMTEQLHLRAQFLILLLLLQEQRVFVLLLREDLPAVPRPLQRRVQGSAQRRIQAIVYPGIRTGKPAGTLRQRQQHHGADQHQQHGTQTQLRRRLRFRHGIKTHAGAVRTSKTMPHPVDRAVPAPCRRHGRHRSADLRQ